MRNLFICIFLLFSIATVNAQDKETTITDSHIYGHVIDKGTQEHLPFINIIIKGTTIGTSTDITGHYFLKNVPLGTHTIVAQSMGYAPIEKEVTIKLNEKVEVNFEIEEDFIMLNDIVISANKNETKRKEAPVVVGLITPKTFTSTNSVSLADGISFQPGLRLESNCQNCGFQQVRINGLEGAYSQILIDGRAINSALSQVYGIEQIPVNMIEKVEVIRGGGSAIFGSNAVAGTINILTKEPTANSISIGSNLSYIGMESPDINTNLNASIVSDDNKAGVTLFASSRDRSAYDHDGDGFTEIGLLKSKNIGFRGFYRTGDYSKLSVEYHTINEFRRGGNNLSLPAHEADITEQTEHDIHSGGIKYDIFSKNSKHWLQVYTSAQSIKRSSYYGAGKDPNAYGNTDDMAVVGGMQYVYMMDRCLFMPASLTSGIEYNYNSLYDEALAYDRVIDQKINIYSAFIQNEWKDEDFSLLLGARLDKHNLIKNPIFSPRLNIRYAPWKNITFRAGYAKGFRAPQAFDEDLHITAVGGEVAVIRLDPNLEAEHSHSFNFSIDMNHSRKKSAFNFLIDGFYTMLNDVFMLVEDGHDANGNLLLTRTNGSGAFVRGLNFEVKYIPYRDLEIQAGFTLQQSRYREPEQWSETIEAQTRMFRSPDTYGFMMIYYNPIERLDISLTGTYTGKMLVQHFAGYIPTDREELTNPFFDLNAKLSYSFNLSGGVIMEINGGMKNIFNSYQNDFDKGELRDAGYIYGPSLPRTIFFGAKFLI